ncbi:M20/M25/M40 family metallo-hydrolase [Streptomyces virginiae]|uniref:M20/M25/M40 family metallo-hydrolase n=1 Tax=Streptomyces virginiae TaxID=1961 RepID=UPI0036CD69B6
MTTDTGRGDAFDRALPGRDALAELARWVGIASVSSDPDRANDVRRSAHWLADTLRRAGFRRAELWETEGLPAVFGCRPAGEPDAPVLLVYSHHDVHAVDPSEWRITPPFSPLYDGERGRLYGRGASDAKGQVMCHLWALDAHLTERDAPDPAVTVKYLVEGEEEVGSVHLADLLSQHADDVGADVVMVSDSMLWSLEEPAVCGVVRGSVTATLTVRGARRDVHSGAVSGAASNAALELCRVVDLLTDGSGRVTLPGFYDAVAEPDPALRASLDTALHRAVGYAYGAPARPIGNGGATPAAQLARACHAPVLFFGTGLPGDRWHGPEERVDVRALGLGTLALTRFLEELGSHYGRV